MTPELQQLMNAQQQAVEQAQFKLYLLGYTTIATIVICAVFSVLIFWKLCQIQKQLSAVSVTDQLPRSLKHATSQREPSPSSGSKWPQDDTRYMPKR